MLNIPKSLSGITLAILFTGWQFLFTGCSDRAKLDQNGVPGKLVVAYYAGDNPSQTRNGLKPVREYLEKKLGMEVELLLTTDYATEIQALQSKKVHLAELPPFAYIIATQKPGLVPLVTIGKDGKPAIYHSFIFTHPHSGVRTMDDLKAHAKELTLCFADPASTSGHLIPRAHLISIGLDPKTAFRETLFAGTHAACIMSVLSGKVDIGCSTNDLAFRRMVAEGTVRQEDAVILWISPPIINDVITARKDLNKDFVRKLKEIYLRMASDDFAVFNSYISIDYPDTRNMAYVPVEDSLYNGLRQVADGIRDINLSR
jgi:phosphonate transport system substrate-binding protein